MDFAPFAPKPDSRRRIRRPDSHEAAHWSYEGVTGPDRWGDLDSADKVCAIGNQQSPIAIDASIPAELPPLQLAWKRQADAIVNNGHTIHSISMMAAR